jgi:hypothetical protein
MTLRRRNPRSSHRDRRCPRRGQRSTRIIGDRADQLAALEIGTPGKNGNRTRSRVSVRVAQGLRDRICSSGKPISQSPRPGSANHHRPRRRARPSPGRSRTGRPGVLQPEGGGPDSLPRADRDPRLRSMGGDPTSRSIVTPVCSTPASSAWGMAWGSDRVRGDRSRLRPPPANCPPRPCCRPVPPSPCPA